MRIPMLQIEANPGAGAHPFPFQVGMQAKGFLHGAMFHAVLGDFAAGEYLKLPEAVARLEDHLLEKGLNKNSLEMGWKYLRKYSHVFAGTVFQNALITFNSHWDWYLRNLHGFIKVARSTIASPPLTNHQSRNFDRLPFASISEQLNLLQIACGSQFSLSGDDIGHLKEMSLVRNLGLHNRWEVDEHYRRSSETNPWLVGELRMVRVEELQRWHASLLRAIQESCISVATKYKDAPKYAHPNDAT